MGIPHLTTFLQPYAEAESIAGRQAVIDGPGLAYHIYYICLSARPAAWSPFEAAPSYGELTEACIAWLDRLQGSNVEIKKIYFDGFLPPSKLDTRFQRLVKQTNQLKEYRRANSTPCRASFPPFENVAGGPSHIPAVKSRLTALPPVPFLVPAVLETLLDSGQYGDITEVVPGEADLYCAKYLSQHGGIVLTGDSDLLLHDLSEDGAVTFFRDIELISNIDNGTLRSQVYHSAAIALRLGLPKSHGLHAFAFELSLDSYGTFRKLLVEARSLKAATASPSEFENFLKDYKRLPAELNSSSPAKTLPIFRSLDPRISEYVLQYPYLAHAAGQVVSEESNSETLRVFLPFLLDCPEHTNAWEVSTAVRQLAYGLINLIVPEIQRGSLISEHRKQQDKSNGRELQLPSVSEIPEACTAIIAQHSQLQQSLPGLSKSQIWAAFAVHQDIQFSYLRAKTPLSNLVTKQLADLERKSDMRKTFTWDTVRFFAQLQGSYYSFRMLKQITNLVVSHGTTQPIPEPLLRLHQQLESLPKICDLPGLDRVSSVIGSLHKGALSTITSLVGGDEEPVTSNQESSRASRKKRKRVKSASGRPAGRGKPSNPFELLGGE